MRININVILEGADADNWADVVGTARNEFPENEFATAEDVLSASLEILAATTMSSRQRLLLQRAVQKRVMARRAARAEAMKLQGATA